MEKGLLYLDSQKRQHRRSMKFRANHFRISALKNIHHTYHHKPSEIKSLISSLYLDCKTCIITDKFQSPTIPVRRDILQGDCLSPLLFNLCFNTFIQYNKSDKYKQLGFSPHDGNNRMFQPVHWFQFADDAAVVTSGEKENQLLLNSFTRWCQWANFIVRVDKCVTFGVKKHSTRSLQIQPKLFICNEIVPAVKNGDSFKYLGCFFDFEMNTQDLNSFLFSLLLLRILTTYLSILKTNCYYTIVMFCLKFHGTLLLQI